MANKTLMTLPLILSTLAGCPKNKAPAATTDPYNGQMNLPSQETVTLPDMTIQAPETQTPDYQAILTQVATNTQARANRGLEQGEDGRDYTPKLEKRLRNTPGVTNVTFAASSHVRGNGADGYFLVETKNGNFIVNNPKDIGSSDLQAKPAKPIKTGDTIFDFNEGLVLAYDLETDEVVGNLTEYTTPKESLNQLYNNTGNDLTITPPKFNGEKWNFKDEGLALVLSPQKLTYLSSQGPTLDSETGNPRGSTLGEKSAGMVYLVCKTGTEQCLTTELKSGRNLTVVISESDFFSRQMTNPNDFYNQ